MQQLHQATGRNPCPRGADGRERLSDWVVRLRRTLLAGLVCLLGGLTGFLIWSLTDPVARPVWQAAQRRAEMRRANASAFAPSSASGTRAHSAAAHSSLGEPLRNSAVAMHSPPAELPSSQHKQTLGAALVTRSLVAVALGGLVGIAALGLGQWGLRGCLTRRPSCSAPESIS